MTAVGIVADIKQDGLDKPVQPEGFSPLTENAQNGQRFMLRGTGDTAIMVRTRRFASTPSTISSC